MYIYGILEFKMNWNHMSSVAHKMSSCARFADFVGIVYKYIHA